MQRGYSMPEYFQNMTTIGKPCNTNPENEQGLKTIENEIDEKEKNEAKEEKIREEQIEKANRNRR